MFPPSFVALSLSALTLMIILSNVQSAESRGVIYNINSVAPCCDQKVQPTAGLGPLPSSICCWERLHQACHQRRQPAACFCTRLADTAGATLWVRRRERFSSCGGISSARTHTLTHYSSRWGDADGGAPRPACACTWRWPCTRR